MASGTVKLKLPSICILYNQKGCNKPKCTYLHICKGFIESTCDGCTLSHDIKSDQPRTLLSGYGLDTSIDGGILTEFYRIGLSRTQTTQELRRLNPPSICSYYNKSECKMLNCTYVHICEKYINNCCDFIACPLSHAITSGQAWEKLSACGFDANKTPEEIQRQYRSDLIRMKQKQCGKTTSGSYDDELIFNPEVLRYVKEVENVRNQAESESFLIGNEDTRYSFFAFRNYKKGECNSSCCKYLHGCGKVVSEKNEKGRYCNLQTRTASGSSEDEQKSIQNLSKNDKMSREEGEIAKNQAASGGSEDGSKFIQDVPKNNTISLEEAEIDTNHAASGGNEDEPKFIDDVPKNNAISLEEAGIVQNQGVRESNFTGNDVKSYPYIVCRKYNKGKCKHSLCKNLHICGKFVLGECDKGLSCNLNHRLFYANNRNVLKLAGYNMRQHEGKLFYDLKRRSKIQMSQKNKGTNQEESLAFSSQFGSQGNVTASVPESSESVVSNYSYLVCRNFNTKGCYYDRCNWLHICNKFVQGKCEKGSSCQKNHMLFYASNKKILHRAGFNTEKSELELFMDYIMKLKDKERINGKEKCDETARPRTQECSGKTEHNRKGENPMENNQRSEKQKQTEKQTIKTGQKSGKTENEQEQKQIKTESTKQSQKQDNEGGNDIIIQDEDCEICLNNLRQRCIYGDRCGRHHCNMPYHWQYKVPTRPWTSFPVEVNETLEMNFCDENTDTAKVSVVSEQCTADFKLMKGKMQDGDILIRRLSTCSFCEAPPGEGLVTKWRWYWKDHKEMWHEYGEVEGADSRSKYALCREMEEKYVENTKNTVKLKIGILEYQVDFKKMMQTDTKNGTQCEVRRRPVFKTKRQVEMETKNIDGDQTTPNESPSRSRSRNKRRNKKSMEKERDKNPAASVTQLFEKEMENETSCTHDDFLYLKDMEKLEFTDGSQLNIPTTVTQMEKVQEKLTILLTKQAATNEEVFDWLEANLDDRVTETNTFVRALMTSVCSSAISGGAKVDPREIKHRGALLQKYLNHQVDLELQALYALQELVHQLNHPLGVLSTIFDTLYDEDIISEDAFNQWERSTDPTEQEGKDIAMKQVVKFFTWLRDEEDSSAS